jgi:predicted N-acyltransferase
MSVHSPDYRTRLLAGIDEVDAAQWDALLPPDPPPFVRHAFLGALEATGCVGPGTGWTPCHLALFSPDGRLAGATPLYRKTHSWGEYVFDWAWADAYERHGLRYFPKLLGAIPFTPVTGPRLLGRDAPARQAVAEALLAQARASRLSSLHVLFPDEAEAALLAQAGCLVRQAVQFHWHNHGYRCFDDFLAALSQPKRKKIRAERRKVAEQGITLSRLTGAAITDAHWRFFDRCYQSTYQAHGSSPYLNLAFFQTLGRLMPEALVMVLAERAGEPIAASLLMRSRDRLYGRYWGAVASAPFLHFECAYYQAIEAAIELGMSVIEGGAQGEHKMARGFLPVATRSAHWLREPAFADAVERFLAREGSMVDAYLDELNERSPFGRGGMPPDRAA